MKNINALYFSISLAKKLICTLTERNPVIEIIQKQILEKYVH
jgi:hypothetical protein